MGSKDFNDISDVDNQSPIEKYDVVFNPGQLKRVGAIKHWNYKELLKEESERGDKHEHEAVTVAGPATKWELENHGTYQDHARPDSWWGHCNGWASYATTEEGGFPTRDITVKVDAEGKIIDCEALGDTSGCVKFRMGDIEALMTELYFSDKATFSGRRCNKDPDKSERDEWGRPKEVECRDLNPGSFHIGVVGLLNRSADHLKTKQFGKIPFVIDHNWDWEVWNFPLVKYDILESEALSQEDAAKLIGADNYVFNDKATKFQRIKLRYFMVSDIAYSKVSKLLNGANNPSSCAPPTPPPLDAGAEGGSSDAGGTSGGPNSCVNKCGAQSDDKSCWCDDQCTKYGDCCSDYAPACTGSGGQDAGTPDAAADAGSSSNVCTVDHCGKSSAAPNSNPKCYCDDYCKTAGDCCSNYAAVCGG